MEAKAAEWGVPLFVGEFGIPGGARRAGDYIDYLYDRLDAAFASAMQWNVTPRWTPEAGDGWNGEDFSLLDAAGRPRPNYRPRPYPRRVAGVPVVLPIRGDGTAAGRTAPGVRLGAPPRAWAHGDRRAGRAVPAGLAAEGRARRRDLPLGSRRAGS